MYIWEVRRERNTIDDEMTDGEDEDDKGAVDSAGERRTGKRRKLGRQWKRRSMTIAKKRR
jgi:hypothetical protein